MFILPNFHVFLLKGGTTEENYTVFNFFFYYLFTNVLNYECNIPIFFLNSLILNFEL